MAVRGSGQAGATVSPGDVPTVTGLDADTIALWDLFHINRKQVFVSGTSGAAVTATKPANGAYDRVWTRDHAYTLWHLPRLFPAAQRQGFIEYLLTNRSDGSGGEPANLVPDSVEIDGTIYYALTRQSTTDYFYDGIYFVILALHADWQVTGSTALFTTWETVINACLDAIPTDANGAVYSDPLDPIIDYGFHDALIKTGATSTGTALLAWSYQMLAEINGESGSGTYTTKLNTALTGLATLRKANDFYMGSDNSDTGVDDVWATALVVAEGLITGQDRTDSAQALKDAYDAGNIAQNGWIRSRTTTTWATNINGLGDDAYQAGGYWAHVLYDVVRAINIVSTSTAQAIADDAATELRQQVTDEGAVGANTAPYEWFNGATLSTPKGYTAHLATFSRFCDASPTRTLTHDTTGDIEDDFSTDTSANYTLSGVSYDGTAEALVAANAADGEHFLHNTSLAADQGVSVDVRLDFGGGARTDNGVAAILRWQDSSNYIFIHFTTNSGGKLRIYEFNSGSLTSRGVVDLAGDMPGDSEYVTLRAWVIGTTAVAEILGKRISATVVINAAGKVGGRHGKGATGTGVSYWDNFEAWALTSGNVPADVALVSDSQLVAPGEEQATVVTNAYLIDAEGDLIDNGSASVGATGVT